MTFVVNDHPQLLRIQAEIEPVRKTIIQHPLYSHIKTLDDLRTFMQFHVYAVWDFMSLLKALQMQLTGITLPWLPTSDPVSRRFINEIVAVEESDLEAGEVPLSHFELYLSAMNACGADCGQIEKMMDSVRRGHAFSGILHSFQLESGVRQFLKNTWDLITTSPVWETIAVFAFAREELIPDMFVSISRQLNLEAPEQMRPFMHYLERHTKIDADEHGPMAQSMLVTACGNDDQKWADALHAILEALEARRQLWDNALEAIHRTA